MEVVFELSDKWKICRKMLRCGEIKLKMKILPAVHWLIWSDLFFCVFFGCFGGRARLTIVRQNCRQRWRPPDGQQQRAVSSERNNSPGKIRKQIFLQRSRCFRWCDRFQNGQWKWWDDGGAGGGCADVRDHQGCFHRQEAQDAQVPKFSFIINNSARSFLHQYTSSKTGSLWRFSLSSTPFFSLSSRWPKLAIFTDSLL